MAKNNKDNTTCVICSKKYHLCIPCERTKMNWKPWKVITDTENCFEIYKVLNDYNFNKITKDEARSLLGKLDLKDIDTYKEDIKKTIKEITKKEKTTKVVKEEKEVEFLNN